MLSKNREYGLVVFLVLIAACFVCGGEPPGIEPPFVGDFFFLKDGDDQSDDVEVVSTKIHLSVLSNGGDSFEQELIVEYKVRNATSGDLLKFAVIGSNIGVIANSEPLSFTRTFLQTSQLPNDVSRVIESTSFDKRELFPVNTFQIQLLPGESREFQIVYKNSGKDFFDRYRELYNFYFWLNPRYRGAIEAKFSIDRSLDAQKVVAWMERNNHLTWTNDANSKYRQFAINDQRERIQSGDLFIEFQHISNVPLIDAVDLTFVTKTSLFILGVLFGTALMVMIYFLVGLHRNQGTNANGGRTN